MLNRNLKYLIPEFENSIAIVANGEFPRATEVLAQLKNSSLIIACDGGVNQLIKNKIVIDYAIGDGDSIDTFDANIKNPYIKIFDQNLNDLSKALNFILENFGSERPLIIYAANGMREDHALANLAIFAQYGEKFANIIMLSDYGVWKLLPVGSNTIATIVGQQISLISILQNNLITCPQLKWPLDKFQLDYLNSGTLNQAKSSQITITNTQPLLVYLAFEIK